MTEAAPDLLTVAEAAASLGVSVRTLRRLLSEAPFAGRTEAIERHTAKGHRMTAMLPPNLMADLQTHFHRDTHPEKRGQAEAGYAGNREAEPQAHSEANGGTPPKPPPNEKTSERANGRTYSRASESDRASEKIYERDSESEETSEADPAGLPALAYQRVIAALETQNAELRADKERLYGALQLAQENLTREQSLRLLGVERAELPTPVNAPPEAVGSPETDGGAAKDTEAGSADAGKGAEGRKAGWWERLWGRDRQ